MKKIIIILTLILTFTLCLFITPSKKASAYGVGVNSSMSELWTTSNGYYGFFTFDSNGGSLEVFNSQNNIYYSVDTSKQYRPSITVTDSLDNSYVLVDYVVGYLPFEVNSSQSSWCYMRGKKFDPSSYKYLSLIGFEISLNVNGTSTNYGFFPLKARLQYNDRIYFTTYGTLNFKAIYGVDSYDKGYNDGLSTGKNQGYDEGYNVGNEEGYDEGYNDGLSTGKKQGYNDGYNDGKTDGIKEGENVNANFGEMIINILDAPRQAISNILNFEILGLNVGNLVFFLITICLVVFVIKFFI